MTPPGPYTMHAAQTHVQRALHSLVLEDEKSATLYLLRALSILDKQDVVSQVASYYSAQRPRTPHSSKERSK